MGDYQEQKALILDYFADMEAATVDSVESVLRKYTSDDYQFFGVHPFNEIHGAAEVAAAVWAPLYRAWTPIQRRQDVFMAGTCEVSGDQWVMSMGHFLGLLDGDWLGIRASRKMTMLRFAEFNSVREGKIVKTGFFCDLIGVMHQMGINPLPPQTGASIVYPGPRTHDGLLMSRQPAAEGVKTLSVLSRMINDLNELNRTGNDRCPPEVLARSWHDDMIWYGPAGIGASYTIERYQQQHQYPFREGLRDKVFHGHVCRFAEGNYACFFGWPNLSNTPTGGFLGLPGGSIRADMRVVDVYRRHGDKLAENWVLMDIPYWLRQQGLDVLERTRSIFNP
ncbi:MAG: nuclear transport factor 2 family protein [Proteobacteria bacterium]|nr:nuclear transport factor 2 family protein [Pseudomonadota bacterium]